MVDLDRLERVLVHAARERRPLTYGQLLAYFGLRVGRITVGALCRDLGRVERLNSWDIVVRPDRFIHSLAGLGSPRAIALTALTFVVVSTVYWAAKHVTLALATYHRLHPFADSSR